MPGSKILDGAWAILFLALMIVVLESIYMWVFFYKYPNVPGLSDLARIQAGQAGGV